MKTHSYLGNPNLSESLDIARCLFHRGLNGPIKRTNSTGTQVIIWQGRPIHKSAQPDEKGELDRSETSLITQETDFKLQLTIEVARENVHPQLSAHLLFLMLTDGC